MTADEYLCVSLSGGLGVLHEPVREAVLKFWLRAGSVWQKDEAPVDMALTMPALAT